ncbi:hypothetical protein J6590_013124 [Homalodisca vitripennis]|nr:hypothetical protein J6590_013124 [Homalodisca vitripennis]
MNRPGPSRRLEPGRVQWRGSLGTPWRLERRPELEPGSLGVPVSVVVMCEGGSRYCQTMEVRSREKPRDKTTEARPGTCRQ